MLKTIGKNILKFDFYYDCPDRPTVNVKDIINAQDNRKKYFEI